MEDIVTTPFLCSPVQARAEVLRLMIEEVREVPDRKKLGQVFCIGWCSLRGGKEGRKGVGGGREDGAEEEEEK